MNVYVLVHPDHASIDVGDFDELVRCVRYVGKANDPAQRLQGHLYAARAGVQHHKYNWIRKLQRQDLEPVMLVIETVDDEEEAFRRETHWQDALFGAGANLLNSVGAPVGSPFGNERRERLGAWQRGIKRESPSLETRRKLSRALKGRAFTPEHGQAISLAKRGKPIQSPVTPEHRAALGASAKRVWATKTSEERSEIAKRAWATRRAKEIATA